MTARIAYLEAVVGADITNFRREMRNVRSELGSVGNAFANIQRAGRLMTFALTAPLVGLGTVLVNSATDFESAMRNINSIAGLSEAQFQALSDRTLELGSNIRSGPLGAAEALYTVFSAGVTNMEAAFSIAEVAAFTAEAGLSDLETTTNALVASLLSYGDVSEDAALRASNSLTRMVQVGVGTMEEFANAVSLVLPTAASAGIGIEDLYGHLAFLTQRGFSASRAATSLNAAITSIINPTQAMEAAMNSLGVNGVADLMERYGTLDQAILALTGTTDGSMESIREMFNTVRGSRAVFAMVTNVDALRAALGEFNTNLDSATMDAWEQQMMSTSAQVDLMKSAFQGLAIILGTHLIPWITPIITGLRDFALHASEANPIIFDLVIGVGAFAAALGPLIWVIGGLANPIVLLTAGLAGLGAWVSSNGDRVREFFDNVFGGFNMNMLETAINQFFDAFNITSDVEVDTSQENWFLNGVEEIPRTLEERLQAGIDNVRINLASTFRHMWNNARNWFNNTLIPEADMLVGGWLTTVADLFSGSSGEDGKTPAVGLFTRILDAVRSFSFEDTFPHINTALTVLIDNMRNWLVTEGVPSFARGVGTFVGEIGQALATGIANIFGGGDDVNLDAMGFVVSGDFVAPPAMETLSLHDSFVVPFMEGLGSAFEDADFSSWADGLWTVLLGILGTVGTVSFLGSLIAGAGIVGSFGSAMSMAFTAATLPLTVGKSMLAPVVASASTYVAGSGFAASVGALAAGIATVFGVVFAGVGFGVLIAGALEEAGVGEDIRGAFDDLFGEGAIDNLNRDFEDFIYSITGNEDMMSGGDPIADPDMWAFDDSQGSPMVNTINPGPNSVMDGGGAVLNSTPYTVQLATEIAQQQVDEFQQSLTENAFIAPLDADITPLETTVVTLQDQEEWQTVLINVEGETATFEEQVASALAWIPQNVSIRADLIINIQASLEAATSAVTEAVDDLLSGLPGHADGGYVPANQLSVVGEEGPELFLPNSSGTIIPNDFLTGGGGGGTTYNEININGVQNVDAILYELRRRGINIV